MQIEEMQLTYKKIRLIATMLLLWVLSNGYHLFHYFGYKLSSIWWGYIICPLLYTLFLIGVILNQRKWIRSLDIEALGFPRTGLVKMILWTLVYGLVALGVNYGWEQLNQLAFRFDIVIEFSATIHRFGLLKGILISSAYTLTYFIKAYLAILIGYYAYHWTKDKGEVKARLIMLLAWLMTLGLSETIYFGARYGFISFISLVVGACLTLLKPKLAHYVWLYLLLSFLI